MRLPACLAFVSRTAALITGCGWGLAVGVLVPTGGAAGVSGTIVYSRAGTPDGTIGFAAGDGSADVAITSGEWPRLSPDGRYLVFHRGGNPYSRGDVWVRDLVLGTETRVYQNNDYVVSYDWTRDGSRIVFDYACGIYQMNRDGSGVTQLLGADCYDDAPAVNPVDGRLVFHNIHSGLWLTSTNGAGRTQIPGTAGGNTPDVYPVWSPDGTRIAFQTNLSYAIVQPDGSGRVDLLANAGVALTRPLPDAAAAWSPDGNWLLFGADLDGTNGLYAVATDGSGALLKFATAPGADIAVVGDVNTNLVLAGTANLLLSLTATPSPAAVGQAFQVVATVRNQGPATATNLVVTNLLPANTRWVGATASQGNASAAGGQVVASFGNLPAGGQATLSLTLVATNAGFLTTTAAAAAATPSLSGPPTASLTVLAVEGTVGALTSPGQQDAYTFHLATSARFYFDALAGDSTVLWTLSGPAGVVVDHRSFQYSDGYSIGDQQVTTSLIPGDYTLTVSDQGDATPAYGFAFLNLADAPVLTLGTPMVADLTPATRTRMWQFPGVAGDQLQLKAYGRTNLNYVSWRVVDPIGQVIFHNSFSDSNPLTLLGPGNYTLLVEGDFSNPGAGTCGFNVLSLGHTNLPAVTGTALSLARVVTDTLAANTTNVYTFTLTNAATLAFDSLTNRNDLNWSLTGPYGFTTSPRGFRYSDGDYGNPLLSLSAGTYALWVTGNNGAAGGYAFRLLDLAAATPMNLDTPINGVLDPGNSTALYSFSVAAGTRLFFDTTNTNVYNTTWRLVDPYGNVVFAQSLDYTYGPLTVTVPGTYTLLIEGDVFQGTPSGYTFQVATVHDGAQALTLGAVTTGAISGPGQVQRYTFSLTGTNLLYFDSLTNVNNLEWSLDGPTGRLVDHRNLRYSDGYYYLSAYWLSPGDYTLTLDAQGDTLGGYRFRFFDLATATPAALDTPVSGTLNPANRTDAYQFTLAGATRMFFDTPGNAPGSAEWRLLDPFGNVIFSQGLNSTYGPVTLTAPGTYTLLIEGYIGDTGTVSYSFQLATVHDGAQALTVGTVTAGAITGPGQVQRYTFSLTSTNLLYFDALTNVNNLEWSLDGPTGRLVDHRNLRYSDANYNFAASWLRPGNYTLTFDAQGDTTGSYLFRLFDLATATPVALDTPVSGSLNPANRTDAYQFTLAGATRVFFDTPGNAPGSTFWRLLDPYGNPVFGQWLNSTYGPTTLTTPGTYTVLLEGYINDTGVIPYSFRVVTVTDGRQSAGLGATIVGTIAEAGQVQRYNFTLTNVTELYFDSLTNSPNLNWSLDGPLGNVVSQRGFAGSDGVRGLSLFRLPPGDYTVTVDANGDTTTPFAFRLLNLATAPTFTTDQTISGTLSPANGTDLYQFTAAAGDTYLFHALASNLGATYWRLVDPYGQVVFGSWAGSDQGPLTLAAAGTYTILMEGDVYATAGVAYSFQLISKGNIPPAPFTGTALTLGATITGVTTSNTATNSYTFTLAAPTTVLFDVLAPSGNFAWSLLGPPGVVVNRQSFSGSDYYASPLPVWSLPAGSYQLSVTGDTGSFGFRLLDLATAVPLTPGVPVVGTNAPANAATLLRFAATAGQPFYYAGGPRAGFTRTPLTVIITPWATQLARFNVDDNQPVIAPVTGTYTLVVTDAPEDTAASGTFGFTLAPIVNATNAVTLGVTVAGAIASPGQQQFYTFTLTNRTRLSVDVLTNDDNLHFTLLGPDGLHYNGNQFSYLDSAANQPFTDCPAGNYLITLNADAAGTPGYSFRLLDFGAAQPFAPGAVVSATNSPASASGLFSFTAQAGAELYYYGLGRSGFVNTSPTAALYAPSGQRVFYSSVDGQSGPFTVPETGPYVLFVGSPSYERGTNGTYQFALLPVTNPTNSLVLGATVNGAIAIPGQVQTFTFNLAARARLHFDTLSPVDVYWTLTGPPGTIVNNADAAYSDAYNSTPWFEAPAGNYTLTLDMSGATTNAFSFRLLDFATAAALPASTMPVHRQWPMFEASESIGFLSPSRPSAK